MANIILKTRRSPSTASRRDIRKAVTTVYRKEDRINYGGLTIMVTRRVARKGLGKKG